jgi:hypothetical protein
MTTGEVGVARYPQHVADFGHSWKSYLAPFAGAAGLMAIDGGGNLTILAGRDGAIWSKLTGRAVCADAGPVSASFSGTLHRCCDAHQACTHEGRSWHACRRWRTAAHLRGTSAPGGRRSTTVPATTFSFAADGPESRASVDELLNLASGDDFARWEAQLAATGNCANGTRLHSTLGYQSPAEYEQQNKIRNVAWPSHQPCPSKRRNRHR